MRWLADDKNIIIKPADNRPYLLVWDRADDLAEAADLLSDSSTYKEVMFGEEEIVRFLKESNGMFKKLLSKSSISYEEQQYFSYGFKKSINLGKKCFLPKIHRRLDNVPGRPVISNYGTPTEMAS